MGERNEGDNFDWLRGPTGFYPYEQAERVAIAIESGATPREAADLAARQVGAGGYGMGLAKPFPATAGRGCR